MFCTKCGNEIAPGSRFCSHCGARVEIEEPVFANAETEMSKPDTELEPENKTDISSFDLFDRADNEESKPKDFEFEWTRELDLNKRAMDMDNRVSFDWSSVIDESHKKVIPDVKSPWDDTVGLSDDEVNLVNSAFNSDPDESRGISLEERVFADAESSKPERSRTESFIDLIKNENSHRPAYMSADIASLGHIEEPLDPTIDTRTTNSFTFDFGDMGREIEKKAEDENVSAFVIPDETPYEPVEADETFAEDGYADHTPDFEEQLAYIRAKRAEEIAEEREAREKEQEHEETRDFLFGDYDTEEKPAEESAFEAPAFEKTEAEPATEAPVFGNAEMETSFEKSMDDELAAILGLDSEFLDADIRTETAEPEATTEEAYDFRFDEEPESVPEPAYDFVFDEEPEPVQEPLVAEAPKEDIRDYTEDKEYKEDNEDKIEGFDIEDAYLDYEPTKRTSRFNAITDEMIAADLLDDDEDEETEAEEVEKVEDTEEIEKTEETAEETALPDEDIDEVDSEIAALQARLAALMERKTGTLDRIMEETEPAPNEVPLEGFAVNTEPAAEPEPAAPVAETLEPAAPAAETLEPAAPAAVSAEPEFVANQKSLKEQLAALGLDGPADFEADEPVKTAEEQIEDLRVTETDSTGVGEDADVEVAPRDDQEFYVNKKSLEEQLAALGLAMPILEQEAEPEISEESKVYDDIEDNKKSLEAQLAALGFYVPDRAEEVEATTSVSEAPAAEPVVEAAPTAEPTAAMAPVISEAEIDDILGKRDEISLDFTEDPVSIPEAWQEKYASYTFNAPIEETPITTTPADMPVDIPEPVIEEPAAEITADMPQAEPAPEIDIPVVAPGVPEGSVANLEGIDIPEVVPEPGQPVMSIDEELAAMGFDIVGEPAASERTEDMMFTADTTTTEAGIAAAAKEASDEEAMSIEELERDLFGANIQSEDAEVTRKMEKFHTLYKKNEEFQQLLDEGYEKLQGGPEYTKMMDVIEEYDKNEEKDYSTQVLGPITTQQIRENIEQERAEAKAEEALAETKTEQPDPSKVIAPVQEPASVAEEAARAESKKKNKAALAKPEKDRGGILTVIAIIVAILLAVLLVIILVLNFWPDSAMAIKINELIGSITGLGAIPVDKYWLL